MGKTTRVSAVAVLDLYDLLLQLGAVTQAQLHAAGLKRQGRVPARLSVPEARFLR